MSGDFEQAAANEKTQTTLNKEAEQRRLRDEQRKQRWRARFKVIRFGIKPVLFLVLLGGAIFLLRDKIFVSIGSGEVAVIYYRVLGGTNHNQICREGLQIVAPWDTVYRYNIRTQSLSVPMSVMTKTGVEVTLEAHMRFHPEAETVPYLHRAYGPDYVEEIVKPELIESIQDVIGAFTPEQLYSSQRGASAGKIFAKAKRTIGGVYVTVDDISLFNLKLPDKVQEAMQAKAAAEQAAMAYEFRVQQEVSESKRKQIEAESLNAYKNVSLPQSFLTMKGIEATLELAKSPNAKIIVIGSKDSLPLVLGNVPDVTAK